MAIKISLMAFNGSIFKARKSFYDSIHAQFASHSANVFTYFPIVPAKKIRKISNLRTKPFKSFLMVLMAESCYRFQLFFFFSPSEEDTNETR